MAEEGEGQKKDDVVKAEDYDKVVVAHNTLKTEKERLEQELNDLKEQKTKTENDWSEQKKANEEFQKKTQERLDKLSEEKEQVVRKGVVGQQDKYGSGTEPVVDESAIKEFKEPLERKEPPREGGLDCYGYNKSPSTVSNNDIAYGGALRLSGHGYKPSPLDNRSADIIVPKNE